MRQRLKQQYICPKDNNEVVTRDDTVKGYEFAKDQYVVLSPEELKALEEKATSTIDVIEFVPLARVDREYLEKVYYLGPDKGGDRAYRLLAAALKETGRAALGQYAARGQQHLVLLRPLNGVLVMEQLHYADEVRPTTEVPIPEGDVKPMELALAKQLIEQTSNENFEPAKYKDTVRERVMETIQRKVDGQEITTEAAADSGGKILDLMEALKASLARRRPRRTAAERRRRRAQGVVMKLLAGTSGYAFKEWKGAFYPKELKDDGMLGYYASKFPAVEINNTFYRLPKENVLLDWAAQVPETFTFAIKASQRITHHARLKPESVDTVDFLLKNTAALGDRLGPILFQLPPNLKKDLDRLRVFLERLPADRRYTVEFRHESWFDDDVFAALKNANVALCISEQAEFTTPVVARRDVGLPATSPVRLRRADAGRMGEGGEVTAVERRVRILQARRGRGIRAAGAVSTFIKACA